MAERLKLTTHYCPNFVEGPRERCYGVYRLSDQRKVFSCQGAEGVCGRRCFIEGMKTLSVAEAIALVDAKIIKAR